MEWTGNEGRRGVGVDKVDKHGPTPVSDSENIQDKQTPTVGNGIRWHERSFPVKKPTITDSPDTPTRTAHNWEFKMIQHENETVDDGEGELEDPQQKMKKECSARNECKEMFELLEECNERVSSKEKTKETCEQELFDFVECVDSCVSKDLFKFLK